MSSKARPRTQLVSTSLMPLALLGWGGRGCCFAWYGCLHIWFLTHSCHSLDFLEHFHPLLLFYPFPSLTSYSMRVLMVAVFIQPFKHLHCTPSLESPTRYSDQTLVPWSFASCATPCRLSCSANIKWKAHGVIVHLWLWRGRWNNMGLGKRSVNVLKCT